MYYIALSIRSGGIQLSHMMFKKRMLWISTGNVNLASVKRSIQGKQTVSNNLSNCELAVRNSQ
jgi:hypothetical protein